MEGTPPVALPVRDLEKVSRGAAEDAEEYGGVGDYGEHAGTSSPIRPLNAAVKYPFL